MNNAVSSLLIKKHFFQHNRCCNRVPYILIPETNNFHELSVLPDEDEQLCLKVSLASLTLRRSGPDTLAEVDLAVDCSVFS